MLGPRAKAQDYQTVGRPHVHCQAKELRRSLLVDCTRTHMQSLKEPFLPDAVVALRESGFASAESAMTSRTARVHGRSIQVGDVVLYTGGGPNDSRGGEVYFHAVLRGELLVGLSHWPMRRESIRTGGRWWWWLKTSPLSPPNRWCSPSSLHRRTSDSKAGYFCLPGCISPRNRSDMPYDGPFCIRFFSRHMVRYVDF